MDAKDHPIIAVLGDQRRFVVPIYQRQYQWTDKHWNAFWEDVQAKAEETLVGKPHFKHYMGALILAPGSDGYVVGATPQVQVVDGQQRLTTFQIFLAALREVGLRKEFSEVAENVGNYLFNRPMSADKDQDARFKLVPTPQDRAVFHNIIDGSLTSIRKMYPMCFYQNGNLIQKYAPNSIQAFYKFIQKIEQYVTYGPDDDEDTVSKTSDNLETQRSRTHALVDALLNHLKIVVITLDESDDAQVIFETLNSKAEPLLAMDLVRNNIFHRAEAQGESADKLFEKVWRPLDDSFWKADSPRAKPRRPRIDHFLSHVLTAQTGRDISLRELYAEYRSFTRPNGRPRFPTVQEELEALMRYAPIYRTLEEGKTGSSLGWIGSKLSVWEITTAYPLIFTIAVSNGSEDIKSALYRLIYSYIVRRSLCGLTPKNLNKTFQRVTSYLLEKGISIESFALAFAEQIGDAVRFPSNDELSNAINTNPIYLWIHKKDKLMDILWELELSIRDKFSVSTPRPLGMSVEHILPQGWRTHWALSDGRKAPIDLSPVADTETSLTIAKRQACLHILGNLTLITVPGNSASSNSVFEDKKKWLKKSLLALNLEIIEKDSWDEATISDRSKMLISKATSIWPSI
ncbi:MAG: DUF262 domain-containing protein [Candidatus Methylomirabilis oxygeniifera]|nr:MAG: DUF262 domain-containing protein [Candidatus Methylomirabilis oxyfera]